MVKYDTFLGTLFLPIEFTKIKRLVYKNNKITVKNSRT